MTDVANKTREEKMKVIVSAIYINEDNKILLLKKKRVWIIPGGKPEPGENDAECLWRECCEEKLPSVWMEIKEKYGEFEGIIPYPEQTVLAKAYFTKISGNFAPGEKISESKFVSYKDALKMKLSNVSAKILINLHKDGYL
jgi:8-oxo-dGTP diphosphatase